MSHRTIVSLLLLVLFSLSVAFSQSARQEPEWWFGGALGANFNSYGGTVQALNPNIKTFSPFSGGSGVGVFLSPLIEYRPDPMWGGILTLGFDGRNGAFNNSTDNFGTTKLTTSMNYISLEPSVRLTPFASGLYFFAGPRLAFNVSKSFTYTDGNGAISEGEWSGTHGSVFGAQLGAGYDIPLSSTAGNWQVLLAPFASFHFGQGPRSDEGWSITTLRAGVAIKFGSSRLARERAAGEVQFSVRAPKIIPLERKVRRRSRCEIMSSSTEGRRKFPPVITSFPGPMPQVSRRINSSSLNHRILPVVRNGK